MKLKNGDLVVWSEGFKAAADKISYKYENHIMKVSRCEDYLFALVKLDNSPVIDSAKRTRSSHINIWHVNDVRLLSAIEVARLKLDQKL